MRPQSLRLKLIDPLNDISPLVKFFQDLEEFDGSRNKLKTIPSTITKGRLLDRIGLYQTYFSPRSVGAVGISAVFYFKSK